MHTIGGDTKREGERENPKLAPHAPHWQPDAGLKLINETD